VAPTNARVCDHVGGTLQSTAVSLDLDLSLDTIVAWKRKPYAMVEDLFGVKPDPWQREALEAFPRASMMAMKACAGPGKTCLLAWLGGTSCSHDRIR
jgi:hypothetical protein